MIVWYRPDGSGNVMEDAEVPDGLLDEGFPQAARPLDEIDRFLGSEFDIRARDASATLFVAPLSDSGTAAHLVSITSDQWLAAHPEGGIVVFDESELA